MLKLQTPKRLRTYGLSAVVAGFVLFTAPVAADASGFGSDVLSEGKENSHVEKLQDLLIEEGYLQQDDASGAYDITTTESVTNYQEDNQLVADGLAGVQTLGALKVLGEGDENTLVTDLQTTLQESGYYNGSLDGYFDSETGDAVKSFQSDADIAVDGLAGPETFGALYYGISLPSKDEVKEEPKEEQDATEEAPEDEGTETDAAEEEAVEEETEASEETSEANEEDAVEEETEASEETSEANEEDAVEEETEASEEASEANEEDAVEEETEASEETFEANEEDVEETDAATEEENADEATTEETSSDADGETYTMEATAYTADCDGCSGVTATGIDLNNNPDKNVVAVDPNVIPLGSTVHVEGYGEAVAGDTGGNINGEKVDLHVPSQGEAEQFGTQNVEVTVLD